MPMSKMLMASVLVSLSSGAWAAAGESGAEMLDCSGLPCAQFHTGSAPVKLLIDTGNAVSVLDTASAKAMKLEVTPYRRSNGDLVPGYQGAILKNLKLGETSLGDVQVLVVDMHDEIAKGTFPKADGSLSYRAIKDQVLTLDFQGHRLSVSAAASDCHDRCGSLSYPTFGPKGPPIVVGSGFEVNGVPLSMQIDTLYSGTMLIFPNAVGKTGLGTESRGTKVRNFPFTDGGVDMIEAEVKRETFLGQPLRAPASVYFATEKVHTPDGMFDGTVGAELFKGRKVTFDFKSNHFWII
jgi:hypothetical protein